MGGVFRKSQIWTEEQILSFQLGGIWEKSNLDIGTNSKFSIGGVFRKSQIWT